MKKKTLPARIRAEGAETGDIVAPNNPLLKKREPNSALGCARSPLGCDSSSAAGPLFFRQRHLRSRLWKSLNMANLSSVS